MLATLLDDTIYAGADTLITELRTYHGGKRIDIDGSYGNNSYSLYQNGSGWQAMAPGPANEYSLTGTSLSFARYAPGYSFNHAGDSTVFLTPVGQLPGTFAIVIEDTMQTGFRQISTIPHSVLHGWVAARSPRNDAYYAATSGPAYNGVEFWKALPDGSEPRVLWSLPNGLVASLSVSEDGTEVIANVEHEDGSPNGYSCWTEYRSADTGIRLDSVNTTVVPDCSEYRQGGASARMITATNSRKSSPRVP